MRRRLYRRSRVTRVVQAIRQLSGCGVGGGVIRAVAGAQYPQSVLTETGRDIYIQESRISDGGFEAEQIISL